MGNNEEIVKEVTVYLDEEEARRFVLFQKHYKTFSLLLESKVFDQKSASVTLNFNQGGTLYKIERNDLLYTVRA